MRSYEGIEGVNSVTALYKSIHRMLNFNQHDQYKLPDQENVLNEYKSFVGLVPADSKDVLVSSDGTKARITARVKDIGAEEVNALSKNLMLWVASNIDTSQLELHQTGMGVIIDKNATYIRQNLIQGLGLAILIISLLHGLII